MKQFFAVVVVVIVILFTSFVPGVGTARLSCISQSGRTLFEAEFEEYGTLEKGKLTIDKDSMLFYSGDNCFVTFDPEVKVYTLNIQSETYGNFDTVRYIQLWAIPASFQKGAAKGTGFADIYTFDAKLRARDPRREKQFEAPLIHVSCKLTYTSP